MMHKPGDICWVKWSGVEYPGQPGQTQINSHEILLLTRKDTSLIHGQQCSTYNLLASERSDDPKDWCPMWEYALDIKLVGLMDLPLYLWMPYRTVYFERLLKGGVV
jgi:hypothetical protein